MRHRFLLSVLIPIALLLPPAAARADSVLENVFATISLDGRKIGHIHYVLKSAPTGEIEELRTNASLSVLGINLYNFVQHLHETWRNGALQTLKSDTDDNGTDEKARVVREAETFNAERNGKPVDLPVTIFPDSIWHYQVTKHPKLFSSVDLRILSVSTARREETITHHGESVSAERFDITGDWDATLWYGKNKRLLKARRHVGGREILVTIDKES